MATEVDEILKSVLKNDGDKDWKVSEKIPLIAKEIANLKQDVNKFISHSYYNIDEILEEIKSLSLESSELIQDMESCQVEIENETMSEIVRSIENHDKLLKEQEVVKFKLTLLMEIIKCSDQIKKHTELNQDGCYYKSVDVIHDLIESIETPIDGYNQLAIYHTFKTTADQIWDNTKKSLTCTWEKMLSWTKEVNKTQTTITIYMPLLKKSTETLGCLVGLLLCNQLQPNVKKFADFLLKEVLKTIVNKECSVYGTDKNKVSIAFKHNSNVKPNYATVLENLVLLFHCLCTRLSISLPADKNLMLMIGEEIKEEFCEMITRDCFMHTVPNTVLELKAYQDNVVKDIAGFQQHLVKINFFPENTKLMLVYLENLDTLFAEKSSYHYLETARTIMIKDLSQTMSIGFESLPESHPDVLSLASLVDPGTYVFEELLPQSLYYFPRCMISKSTQELLDLINVIMEQASESVVEVGKKLYLTVRFIFELYDAVVPYHHENFLQTIPQYVALFHNNCMYLAHNLLTFGDKWRRAVEGRNITYPIGFLDLVLKLRDLGNKHLVIHLQQQRKQILDNIRSSDLNCMVVKDVLGENAEQAIRQCLRQLHLLKNVWIGVLPPNVFTKLMATLVNMFVDEIIHRVCTVEDISAEMATQLTEIYTIVVNKAPNLFKSPRAIEIHVKSWVKLQELILVLGGSLKDIEKQWNDGTGPLAVHFRTEELRNLIKALFQNTQLRANLLSKIK